MITVMNVSETNVCQTLITLFFLFYDIIGLFLRNLDWVRFGLNSNPVKIGTYLNRHNQIKDICSLYKMLLTENFNTQAEIRFKTNLLWMVHHSDSVKSLCNLSDDKSFTRNPLIFRKQISVNYCLDMEPQCPF